MQILAKKRFVPALLLLLTVLIVIGWLCYPRPLSAIVSDFTPEQTTHCTALLLSVDPEAAPIKEIQIPVDSEEFRQLMTLLQSTNYRLSISRYDSFSVTLNGYYAHLLINGETFSFSLLFPGDCIFVTGANHDSTLKPVGGRAFQQQVVDYLLTLDDGG